MTQEFDKLRNLSKLEIDTDGAYICTLEMYDEGNQIWETIPFVYRPTDRSRISRWIEKQIDEGNAPPVTQYVPPPPPPTPVVDRGASESSNSGPTVA